MKILIVEDEKPIAGYIEGLCRSILKGKIGSIQIIHSLERAQDFMFSHPVDLCLLDLNLHGRDGFELLKNAVAGSFHTIVISAYSEKAVKAFEYGVLDFIPKPFGEERLKKAFDRYYKRLERRELPTRYLSARSLNKAWLIPVTDIRYLKAEGHYVEACLVNDKRELLSKSMDRLEQLLPVSFLRIHRSYMVNLAQVRSYNHAGGGSYQVEMKSGDILPVSRSKYKRLQELLNY